MQCATASAVEVIFSSRIKCESPPGGTRDERALSGASTNTRPARHYSTWPSVGRRLPCQPTWHEGTLPHRQACTASLCQARTIARYVLRTKHAASVAYDLMRHGAATTQRAYLASVLSLCLPSHVRARISLNREMGRASRPARRPPKRSSSPCASVSAVAVRTCKSHKVR